MNFGNNIKTLRLFHAYSVEQMADLLEVEVCLYHEFEAGLQEPAYIVLSRILSVFKIANVSNFLTGAKFEPGYEQVQLSLYEQKYQNLPFLSPGLMDIILVRTDVGKNR